MYWSCNKICLLNRRVIGRSASSGVGRIWKAVAIVRLSLFTSSVGTVFSNTLLLEREVKVEVTARWGRRPKQLLDALMEKRGYWNLERGSTRSQFVENLLWKRLWTCRNIDCRMSEWINEWMNEWMHSCGVFTVTYFDTGSLILRYMSRTSQGMYV